MADAAFESRTWESGDGLSLHYRDYPGRDDRPPILCIPGLTRNARDFEPVADAFAGEWRVICAELRGRGESEYAKDSATYMPAQYAQDIGALFDQAKLDKVVAIGTSLGGIITMLMAAENPDRFAGVVLNDIGPVIEEEGLDRIKDYVGHGRSYPTWVHAARALKETNALAYPDYEMRDWLVFAKRVMCISGSGRITYDYDMHIADPFEANPRGDTVDMWPMFKAIAGRPAVGIRGELSDILSAGTFARMAKELPEFEAVTIPRVGHAPTLGEPEAQTAIANLLAKVA